MMEPMKAHAEMHEGPQAFERFRSAMKDVLAVPHSEIQKRIERHRAEAQKKSVRPGPKPKRQQGR